MSNIYSYNAVSSFMGASLRRSSLKNKKLIRISGTVNAAATVTIPTLEETKE